MTRFTYWPALAAHLKHSWIQFREKLAMKRFHGALNIGVRHHKTQIQKRRALRDHSDVDFTKGREYTGRDARGIADIVTHQTNNGLRVFHRNVRELA